MDEGTEAAEAPRRAAWTGVLLFGMALSVALGAIAYRSLDLGEPDADVAAVDPNSIEAIQARAEAAPNDPAAWQELGFARFERGEYDLAAAAYTRATELDGTNAVLWSALGEALVMASERDPMPAAALAAFRRAAEADPDDPRARYFLAVKQDLDGQHEGAIAAWLALLADTPPGAPWEVDLARTIEQVGKINSISTEARIAEAEAARAERFAAAPAGTSATFSAGGAIPGPSAEQIAAARGIPPGEQRQMAEGMVASLEGKLRTNPANPDGWVMLMRSRMTLGQSDLARKALADALAANPGAAQRLRSEAEVLGVR